VIAVFIDGGIENGALLMPGCGGRKRYRHRKEAYEIEKNIEDSG
jgi:hypothetical protein